MNLMNRIFYSCLPTIFIIIACFTGCKKSGSSPEEPVTGTAGPVALASLSTTRVSAITTTSATVEALVSGTGGGAVTSRGVCWAKTVNPTISGNKAEAALVKGSGEFSTSISGLEASSVYYVRSYATNAGGTNYGNELQFTTAAVTGAEFALSPLFIAGSTLASCDAEIKNDGGATITERGICWATSAAPTVGSNRMAAGAGIGKFRVTIKNLAEKTTYYLRAYAVNASGISYSEELSLKTIAKGNITYTFNKSAAPTAEETAAYSRLQVAIDSAVWYLNNYTSAKRHVYLNYVPDVPTADANSEGWMRFGSNSSYQNLRTMLHELNHTIGNGTTSFWTNNLILNGVYQGVYANQVLRYITADAAAQIKGDTQHFWPYGLNQNSEVTSSWDYVYNCLIVEGMRRDGLTGGGIWSSN